MKLTSVRIQNFRSFLDETIPLSDYTCLVGPNGAGKSTVVAALDVFFRHAATSGAGVTSLVEEDFHAKHTAEAIRVTLTFENLSTDAQSDFKDYYRNGKLIVFAEAVWDPTSRTAAVVQRGMRVGMDRFKKFFAMASGGASAKDLKAEYAVLRAEIVALPAVTTKDDMADALHAHESANLGACVEIPSSDEFYGFTRGTNRLAKYVQWVHVPAVKDAGEETDEARDTWLGLLLARAVRTKVDFAGDIDAIKAAARGQYDEMLSKQQAALEDLSKSLTTRMAEWASPDSTLALKWRGDSERAVSVASPLARVLAGDGRFEGELTRHGHGFQRSYLLALLQEVAAGGAAGPRLILACEEPELYQHPPQARHLASVFEKLSRNGVQILVCTHSPLFVSGRAFEDVRLFRRKQGASASTVRHTAFAEVAAKLKAAGLPGPQAAPAARARLHQALHAVANEMFFSPVLVLVEGVSDSAYLTAHLAISDKIDEFRRLGCHIVPAGGKGYMPELLAVAKLLDIPTFVVFDADDGEANPARRQKHEQENAAILHLALGPGYPAFPAADAWLTSVVQWRTDIEDRIKTDFGDAELVTSHNNVRNAEGLVSEPGMTKNGLYIGLVLADLDLRGKQSASLERLAAAVLEFGRATRAAPAVPTPATPPLVPAPEPDPPSPSPA